MGIENFNSSNNNMKKYITKILPVIKRKPLNLLILLAVYIREGIFNQFICVVSMIMNLKLIFKETTSKNLLVS